MDKHTFTSYGLFFPIPQDSTHRARYAGWDTLPWLNYCDSCKISMEEDNENLEAKGQKCLRLHDIKSIRRFRPEAFAPQVSQARVRWREAVREPKGSQRLLQNSRLSGATASEGHAYPRSELTGRSANASQPIAYCDESRTE